MFRKDFSIVNGINMSLATVEERQKIFELLLKHQAVLTAITPAQTLAVYGLSPQKLRVLRDDIAAILPVVDGIKGISIQCCPGMEQCRRATADSLTLGRKIDRLTFDHPLPHKVKIAVAGCARCCTAPYLKDVGIVAKSKGWSVLFGGNAGGSPRIADLPASGLREDEVVALVKRSLDLYIAHAGEKTAHCKIH
jgi:NAD(P)H-nitrite reductase large subunit